MYPESQLLVHLCPVAQWQAAREVARLEPESLRSQGFVHLSTPQQAHLPANRLFAGRTDTLLLFVERHRLTAPLRWEPGVPGDPAGMRFPHLYGPLPREAIVHVSRYLPRRDGCYPPLPNVVELSDLLVLSTAGLPEYRQR